MEDRVGEQTSSRDLRELQEELSDFVALVEHRGFRRLMKWAEEQTTSRQNGIILTPLKRMDEVLEQEFAKGEVAGIRLFASIVPTQMEQLKIDIDYLAKRSEDDEQVSDE